jgi:hypothetical protein
LSFLNYETRAICRTLALASAAFEVAVEEKPAGRFMNRSRGAPVPERRVVRSGGAVDEAARSLLPRVRGCVEEDPDRWSVHRPSSFELALLAPPCVISTGALPLRGFPKAARCSQLGVGIPLVRALSAPYDRVPSRGKPAAMPAWKWTDTPWPTREADGARMPQPKPAYRLMRRGDRLAPSGAVMSKVPEVRVRASDLFSNLCRSTSICDLHRSLCMDHQER